MSFRDDLFRFTPVKPILDSVKTETHLIHITLEKWLCATRICKTRALARQYLGRGRVRNEKGEILSVSTQIKVGDRLCIEYGHELRHIQIISLVKKMVGIEQRPLKLYRETPPQPTSTTQRPVNKPTPPPPYFPSDYANTRVSSHFHHERERSAGGVNFLRRGKNKTR